MYGRRVPAAILAILALAALAPHGVTGVPAPEEVGWTRLLHDCDADHQGINDDGYDLVALDLAEDTRLGKAMLLFRVTLDGRTLLETGTWGFNLRFEADGTPYSTVIASSDDIDFIRTSGSAIDHIDAQERPIEGAEERLTVEVGYEYATLDRLRDHEPLSGFRVSGWTGDSTNVGDHLHGCDAGEDTTARFALSEYKVQSSNIPNRAPQPVISWAPALATTRDLVVLNGTATDPDEDAVTSWEWAIGDVDGGSTSDRQQAFYKWRQPGDYRITLTVRDALGAEGVAEQTISVGNGAPTARIAAPTVANLRETVQFRHASFDEDGRIVSFHWDFGDGGVSDAPDPTHAFGEAGNKTVSLRVIDDDGGHATATHVIRILAEDEVPDAAPTAFFRLSPPEPVAGQRVFFYDQSTDDRGITSWLWDFGDQRFSNQQHPNHTYSSPGRYQVNLTVTDAGGSFSHLRQEVVVLDPSTLPRGPENRLPIASFLVVPTTGIVGQPLRFSDTSHDPDGTIVDRFWDFGDGTGAVAARETTHVFQEPGDHTVTLTVVDDAGGIGTVASLVIVDGIPNDKAFDGDRGGAEDAGIPGPKPLSLLLVVAASGMVAFKCRRWMS